MPPDAERIGKDSRDISRRYFLCILNLYLMPDNCSDRDPSSGMQASYFMKAILRCSLCGEFYIFRSFTEVTPDF